MSLNQPSFESLREFVEQEIKMSTSDYALAFFKSEGKDKSRDGVAGRGEFRVRQVAVGNSSCKQSDTASGRSSGLGLLLTPNVNISLVIRNLLFVLSVRRSTVAETLSRRL